ncbi:MAG TPA: hypothetical protein VI911_08040 [Patescibacteria group bacterium]|nr:hypothetical protein [Patescibacteria group bacterium]
MIRANVGENFPILVSLFNEEDSSLASGETVYYDVRRIDDSALIPPINGTLIESTVEAGLYKTAVSIDEAGIFICYATCSGFLTSSEEILVNEQNIYNIVNNTRHYNISVEDVLRLNATPTASQTARNVPLNKTDYVITKIKSDDASDWSSPVASGTVHAHYRTSTDTVPYLMGGPF